MSQVRGIKVTFTEVSEALFALSFAFNSNTPDKKSLTGFFSDEKNIKSDLVFQFMNNEKQSLKDKPQLTTIRISQKKMNEPDSTYATWTYSQKLMKQYSISKKMDHLFFYKLLFARRVLNEEQ
jgi:hypothetical protein